ncbi:MAG: YbfB/YjiJ family MFS transporter [Ancalomicrobiaceae bacterium]|nr:YbfB/YjiJ family MFS transporter [Ancalomicrobiaceae bacterium]
MPTKPRSPLAVCLAAASALAVAMGVGRFAFTPMLPLMVRDGGLDMAASPYLAAINYLTYLVGGLTAARLPWPPAKLARLSLVGVGVVTVLMGTTGSLWLWLVLRGLAGLFSGWALVGVSTWALGELAHLGRPRLAAVVYAGVGAGIALAGLFCLIAARPGITAARLWLELGGLALVALAAPLLLLRGGPGPSRRPPDRISSSGETPQLGLLTLCYGIFGFGYILPATFLPALARQTVDDPAVFGLVWPLFGSAAAVSTLLAGAAWIQHNRLRAWAGCHGLMACGALLPVFRPTEAGLAVSALLVGGTFVVVTMLGMQEARLRSPDHAAAALSQMTGAFALGQLAGPLAVALLPSDGSGLALGLAAAGFALLATVPLLWRLSCR